MKKDKKNKKEKPNLTLVETLREQADQKNGYDCESVLNELNEASKEGEYSRTVQIKINQAQYIETLGLTVEKTDKWGFYKISW